MNRSLPRFTAWLAGTALIGLSPGVAAAGTFSAEQATGLPDPMNQREREGDDLHARLSGVPASTQEPEIAATGATPEPQQPNKIVWNGVPEFKSDDGWSFKPRGRIQYDVSTVNAPDSIVDMGLGFSSGVRRIRLGASGTIPGGFGYKLEADFVGGDVTLTDAFFTYVDGGLTVTLGQHNNFQGLEELSSTNDTSFIERAGFTDAFGFQRKVGVSVQYGGSDLLFQTGVFTDSITDLDDVENDSIGFDVRAVAMPRFGDVQTHFAASYHVRELGNTTTTRRYRQRPAVFFTDIRFIDTGNIGDTTGETNYGLEAAVIAGRFHAAAESHWLTLNRSGNLVNPSFFGGAVEAGFFLTDDTRGYKDGLFKGVKVAHPVGQGGLGAWQVNVRYDHLDLTDGGFVGGRQDAYQASLIWTPIDPVRLLLSYSRLDYSNAAVLAGGRRDYGVDAFAGRFQISF